MEVRLEVQFEALQGQLQNQDQESTLMEKGKFFCGQVIIDIQG